MSLVYLVTHLPRLRLATGKPVPVTRAELIPRAQEDLEGTDLVEFERVVMLEEVAETVRVMHEAHTTLQAPSPVDVAVYVRTQRTPTALGRLARDLPEWVLDPLPQHVLMRRYWQRLVQDTQLEALRTYAQFHVNLEEALTALRCQRAKLSRSDFLEQMSGHFDSSARVIVDHYGDADLGIGQRFAWWPRLVEALDAPERIVGERAINALRLSAIDTLEGIETFSLETVLATYYRLGVLEREASWDRDAGLAILDQILSIPALEQAIGAAP